MKKVIIMIAAMCIAGYSFGQLGLGIKGAFNMGTLTTDFDDYEKAAQVGFQAGAFVRIGDKWHIQPEAYFTSKSGELKYDKQDGSNSISFEQNLTLNSIDVPVLIGYKIIDPPTMNLRVQAGPVASFVMNKDLEFTTTGGDLDNEANFNEDDFKNMNLGLQLGAGVDFLFLTLDVRYEIGLNKIYEKPDDVEIDPNFKYNVFFVSLGWKIL